jgi:hypothetical protein
LDLRSRKKRRRKVISRIRRIGKRKMMRSLQIYTITVWRKR